MYFLWHGAGWSVTEKKCSDIHKHDIQFITLHYFNIFIKYILSAV
jgi:hypothetical protein